jgi:hypothetical protein
MLQLSTCTYIIEDTRAIQCFTHGLEKMALWYSNPCDLLSYLSIPSDRIRCKLLTVCLGMRKVANDYCISSFNEVSNGVSFSIVIRDFI